MIFWSAPVTLQIGSATNYSAFYAAPKFADRHTYIHTDIHSQILAQLKLRIRFFTILIVFTEKILPYVSIRESFSTVSPLFGEEK